MDSTFKFPQHVMVCYALNPQTGRYTKKPERIPFNKLPVDLKIEHSQKDFLKQQGANEVITGRIKNGKREFFTGLIPVHNSTAWYFGNDFDFTPDGKKYSLIVFNFSPDNSELIVFYFNHYYKHNREQRVNFILGFIKNKRDQ